MTGLAVLKRDLAAALTGFHIRGHYRANAIAGTRRYALFVNGTHTLARRADQWRSALGSALEAEPTVEARAAFDGMSEFVRASLAASAPWDIRAPQSVAMTLEFLDVIDADACTPLGLQVWRLCREEWRQRYEREGSRENAKLWALALKGLRMVGISARDEAA